MAKLTMIIDELIDELDIGDYFNFGTDKNQLHTYTDIYGEILPPYVGRSGTLLELGVMHGGSPLLWQHLLPKFHLCCVDIENRMHRKNLSRLDFQRMNFLLQDAYCEPTKKDISLLFPDGFDLIIDDGPHTLESQIFCLQNYLPMLKYTGTLIIEDIVLQSYLETLIQYIPGEYVYWLHDNRHNKPYDLMMVVQHLGYYNSRA